MKKKKSKYGVMICMPRPSDKRIVDETAEYIRNECKISWIGLSKGGVYAEAPEYARNDMVAEARKGDITHIMTLDADTVPPPDTILRLLTHDRDIIAGVYPLFVGGKKCWSFSLENRKSNPTRQDLFPYQKLSQRTFKVMALSGSTVLIKKEVFDHIEWPWYKTVRSGSEVLMGHDFDFSNKAREAGYELWVDPTIQCRHYNIVELNAVFNAGV